MIGVWIWSSASSVSPFARNLLIESRVVPWKCHYPWAIHFSSCRNVVVPWRWEPLEYAVSSRLCFFFCQEIVDEHVPVAAPLLYLLVGNLHHDYRRYRNGNTSLWMPMFSLYFAHSLPCNKINMNGLSWNLNLPLWLFRHHIHHCAMYCRTSPH